MNKKTIQNAVLKLAELFNAYVEVEAMKAENKQREINHETLAYVEQNFIDVIDKYRLGYNDVIRDITGLE